MANLCHLFGDGFEAVHRAAVDPADSTLALTKEGVAQNFSGSQIQSVATPVGDLVTLVADASGPTTSSFFVPEAAVPPGRRLGFTAIGVGKGASLRSSRRRAGRRSHGPGSSGVSLRRSSGAAAGDRPRQNATRRRERSRRRATSLKPGGAYFRFDETSLKVFCRWVPTAVTAAMIATAMSEAIRAYSMAVAPDSLATKFLRDLIMLLAPAA